MTDLDRMKSLLYELMILSVSIICLKTYYRGQKKKKLIDKSVDNLIRSFQVVLAEKNELFR